MDNDEFDFSSDDEIEEIAIENEQKLNEEESDFDLFNQRELITELNSIVNETSQVIGISPGVCKILLHNFHWNKEHMIEKFYEANNKDQFLRNCHVVESNASTDIERISTCQICFDDLKLTGLSCAHLYCANCWKNYLTVKICDEGLWLIPCPGLKCARILDEEMVVRLVPSQEVINSYRKQMINSFVQSSSTLKWCPGIDCEFVARVPQRECRPITCKCRTVFCFACGYEWHRPVDCEMLKKWLKKCNDDSETSNWLNANTKDCPQCHVTIEKDGGCNHMTCKNVACRFEFCWTCLGPWKPHGSGWYSCNRFDDSEAKKARDEQERSRAALQRYLHYYNRFMNHKNSLKLEKKLLAQIEEKMKQMQQQEFSWIETQYLKKLLAQIEEKMKQMQQQEFSWIETQYLKKAVDVLNECRRTLMFTYAFAFFLEKSNQTIIYENNQQDLELATEQLSELLEKDLEVEKNELKTWKQNVQDKYRYVANRRLVLLQHVDEGNAQDQWVFNTKP